MSAADDVELVATSPLPSSNMEQFALPPLIAANLVEIPVMLPTSARQLAIARPGLIDPILDFVSGDPEQNLPYWAEIWPSGIALADAIATDEEAWRGRSGIELGCGVGVTAISAVAAGVDLVVTDYAPEALALCRQNCVTNGVPPPPAATLNWRDGASIRAVLQDRRFDVVFAADVLYERRDIEPLLELIPRLLQPGGTLWLAEPGRPAATEFLARTAAEGWEHAVTIHPGPWPDPADNGVTVSVHCLRPPVAPAAADCGVC